MREASKYKFDNEYLKKCRKEMKLSRTQFSQLCNVNRCSLTLWEAGGTIPTIDALLNISKALNEPVERFFKEKENENN